MNDNFIRSQKFVGLVEGKDNFNIVNGQAILKSKSKNDTGGPTRFGVTHGTLQRAFTMGLVSHNDITKMTKEEANIIFEEMYWKVCKADKMEWGLCLVHYDCAINCGNGGAAKQLQRALIDLGADIKVDAVVGPKTLSAISQFPLQDIVKSYLKTREKYYYGIVNKNQSQNDFLKGWLNRLDRLEALVS